MADTFISDLKQRIDLVELVTQEVELRHVGKDYVGLCPFHSENTPSFHCNRDFFNCFGCGAKGDCLAWIQKTKRIGFKEAVQQLKDILKDVRGHTVSRTKKTEPMPLYSLRDFSGVGAILHANYYAQRRYEALLPDERLSADAIERFKLRYAGESPDIGGWGPDWWAAGFFARRSDGTPYHRYRNRTMIPLCDREGIILGFAGRTTLENSKVPKYLNPIASNAFSKKRYLYGLNHLTKNPKTIIVVEGLIDCIQLLDAGVPNVVSSMGCDLSIEQLRILEHYAKRIIILFDGDMPGLLGAAKVAKWALTSESQIDLMLLSNDLDPEELIKTHGKRALKQLPVIPATNFLERRLMAKALKGEWDRTLLNEMSKKFVDDNVAKGWPHYNQIDWVCAAYPQFASGIKASVKAMMDDHEVVNGKKTFKKERILAFLKEWAKPCKEVRLAHANK